MVRVNLLPDRRKEKARTPSEPGQLWLIAVLAVIVCEVIVLIVVHKMKQDELKAVVAENSRIQGQIDQIKRQIANQNEIKAQLKELVDREEAINKLQAARTGPTSTMMELSRILTSGKGPTTDKDKLEQLKRDNPTAVMNANWDPKRLWLTSYNEVERQVKITGMAKDGEDISEFQKRLTLSDFFYDVSLLPGSKVFDDKTKQELVRFEFSAKVRY
jgi:type IV pilus assembly protein PilN